MLASIVKTAMRLLSGAIALWVKDPERLILIQAALGLPVDVVDRLSDDNPNDDEQMLDIVNTTIKNSPLRTALDGLVLGRIARLDPDIRPIPESIYAESLTIADLLTDDDTDNNAQMRAYLKRLPADPDADKLLTAVIGIWADPQIAEDLSEFILNLLAELLERDDPRRKSIETWAARKGKTLNAPADPDVFRAGKK